MRTELTEEDKYEERLKLLLSKYVHGLWFIILNSN